MSGTFANMDEKSVAFIIPRMTWDELAANIAGLGTFMVRGDIPANERAAYQEHAARLHAAAKAILFVGEKFPDIRDRIMDEEKKRGIPDEVSSTPSEAGESEVCAGVAC